MTKKMPDKQTGRDLIARNLSELMAKKALSDAELGRQLGHSRVTIWRWRMGKLEPFGESRDSLAAALKVPIARLYQAS